MQIKYKEELHNMSKANPYTQSLRKIVEENVAGAKMLKIHYNVFFCEKPEEGKRTLHKAQTYRLDAKVRRAAKETNSSILYAKLENGDVCPRCRLSF